MFKKAAGSKRSLCYVLFSRKHRYDLISSVFVHLSFICLERKNNIMMDYMTKITMKKWDETPIPDTIL